MPAAYEFEFFTEVELYNGIWLNLWYDYQSSALDIGFSNTWSSVLIINLFIETIKVSKGSQNGTRVLNQWIGPLKFFL